jgi:hypothetical protein
VLRTGRELVENHGGDAPEPDGKGDRVVREIHRALPNASPLPNRQSKGLTLARHGRTPAGIVPGLCCVLWS